MKDEVETEFESRPESMEVVELRHPLELELVVTYEAVLSWPMLSRPGL